MNRKIKFRQYLGKGNWHYFGFIKEKNFSDKNFAGLVGQTKTYEEIENECQQYTGFKDKNEKEIYEGDIIQLLTTHVRKGKVFFDINKGKWIVDLTYCKEELALCVRNKCCVIGNILENPELLEKIRGIKYDK